MAQAQRTSPVEGSSLLLKKLNELCQLTVLDKNGEPSHGTSFQEYINQQRSERSHDQALFAGFVAELEEAILQKAGSERIHDKMGAAVAIEDILKVQLAGDDPAKFDIIFKRIGEILNTVEEVSSIGLDERQKPEYQQKLLKFTTKVYGRLIKTAGPGFTSVVEDEAKSHIAILSTPTFSDLKRFTAVLLLTEMANNCSSVFISLLPSFLANIFSTLTHKQLYIREASATAAQAALRESRSRKTRFRMQDHYILLEQVMVRVKPHASLTNTPVEVLHGSLLALKELLAVSAIMLSRYAATAEQILKMKDHRDILIRKSVISLFPTLADFAPHFFARDHLVRCLEHLLTMLKSANERGLVYNAIGDMFVSLENALPAADGYQALLQQVVGGPQYSLKVTLECVMQQRKAQRQQGHAVQANLLHCNEALQCIGKLAKALKGDFRQHARHLIEHMVLTGLSKPLYDSLKQVTDSIPELKSLVQAQLMDLVAWVLGKKSFYGSQHNQTPAAKFPQAFQGETIDPSTQALALEIISEYLYMDLPLTEFMVDTIQPLIDHKEPEVKRHAVRCAIFIIGAHLKGSGRSTGRMNPSQVERTMDKVFAKVMSAAMSDPNPKIRKQVVEEIYKCKALEPRLAMFDCIEVLLLMLEDDKGEPQLLVKLLVNIAKINPYNIREQLVAYMKEKLRHILHHPETEIREKSAVLLDSMLGAAVDITHDYVEPVQKILVKQLLEMHELTQQHQDAYDNAQTRTAVLKNAFENSASTAPGVAPVVTERMMECLLRSLGNVARVSGTRFTPYVKTSVELVVRQIEGGGTPEKRAAAVTALGQILKSCGGIVEPYIQFPKLMGHLLRMMHEGKSEHRVAAMRTVGVIGALDPHTHKLNLRSIAGEGKLEKEGVRPVGNTRPQERTLGGTLVAAHLAPAQEDVDLLPCVGMATNNEDYYPTIAINTLMRVLRDRSCASLHAKAVSAVMEIFLALNAQAVPFLDKVMPVLFKMMQKNDEAFRKMLLEKLMQLVSCMRQHLTKFMREMMRLTLEHFDDSIEVRGACLALLAKTSLLMRECMRHYIPGFMVKFMEMLTQIQESGNLRLLWPFLDMMVNLAHLNEIYLPELYRYIIRLAEPKSSIPEEDKIKIIEQLKKVLPRTMLTKFAPEAMYPLHTILESPSSSRELRLVVLDAMAIIGTKLYHYWDKFVPSVSSAYFRVKDTYGVHHEWIERLLLLHANLRPPPTTHYATWVGSDGWSEELDKVDTWMKDQARVPPYNPEREVQQFAVDVSKLIDAFLITNIHSTEDWLQWLRKASLELLSQSPSPALRVCQPLAAVHPTVAKELFAVGFVSGWQTMSLEDKANLKKELALIVRKPRIPSEVSSTLLNLAEYMELDEKDVPLSRKSLGHVAKRCGAFAKALHHTEEVFIKMLNWSDEVVQNAERVGHDRAKMLSTTVEDMIDINNRLGQLEAAKGVLAHAQQHLKEVEIRPEHYDRLQRWEEARKEYDNKLGDLIRLKSRSPEAKKAMVKAMAGKVRCHFSMLEFEEALTTCKTILSSFVLKPEDRAAYAEVKALSEWHMKDSREFAESLRMLRKPQYNWHILESINLMKNGQYKKTIKKLEEARNKLAEMIATPLSESYDRAYHYIFKMQWMAQIEESVDYLRAEKLAHRGVAVEENREKMAYIRKMWDWRLECVERSVEKWQAMLSLREMVIPAAVDEEVWIKFAKLCSKSGRAKRGRSILVDLLGVDPVDVAPGQPGYGAGTGKPHVMLAWLEHMWHVEKDKEKLVPRLRELVDEVMSQPREPPQRQLRRELNMAPGPSITPVRFEESEKPIIQARVNKRLGHWLLHLHTTNFTPASIEEVKYHIHEATHLCPGWAKAWHLLARFHTAVMLQFEKEKKLSEVDDHVAPAIIGYFNALQSARHIGDSPNNQQDLLRLLTLWFKYGHLLQVQAALTEGFDQICANLWLHVIPQIIARIHHPDKKTRELIIMLLTKVGEQHPQALMFPLLVATASKMPKRKDSAKRVLENLRAYYAQLVREAETVAQELNRIAVLWHEKWHERMEEASRLYFGEQDAKKMLQELLPLHEELEKAGAATTVNEMQFIDAYGAELRDAHGWLKKFHNGGRDTDLQQAWDLYYHIFRKINKQQGTMTVLDLQYVSPALQQLSSLQLCVPGTYIPGDPIVLIASFSPQLQVLPSKQRPRRLIIVGNDGQQYQFLLKGHEDLRQDERVMQLFGLVNNLLAHDRTTADKDLSIGRFAVVPLHPQSGLIGWLLNTDTLHVLIKEYRDAHKVQLNLEHRRMLSFAPDWDTLSVIQKIEVFMHAQDPTEEGNAGDDLHKVLWLKSRSSEVWVGRRTDFVRSTAVMSMVGFLLGLGDRHPSNILLDRYSGKLLHIDFGDCFETAMKRDKFPEKVPFRLTRMREADSLLAMLETFVHDPLLNWRLGNTHIPDTAPTGGGLRRLRRSMGMRRWLEGSCRERGHQGPCRWRIRTRCLTQRSSRTSPTAST